MTTTLQAICKGEAWVDRLVDTDARNLVCIASTVAHALQGEPDLQTVAELRDEFTAQYKKLLKKAKRMPDSALADMTINFTSSARDAIRVVQDAIDAVHAARAFRNAMDRTRFDWRKREPFSPQQNERTTNGQFT